MTRASFVHSAAILAALLLLPAQTVTAQGVSTQDVYACAAIEADDERLTCYDEAVGRLEAAEAAGELATITREDVEEVERESFGFSIPSLPRLAATRLGREEGEGIREVEYGIASISRDRSGKLLIRLENNQIWRQTDTMDVFYSPKRGAERATIRRGALSSYRLKLDNGAFFRVRRVE